MATRILTDSGCDLTKEEAARYGVDIVPLYIIFGSERLRDGVDIDRPTFYRRMNGGEMPGTEPATQADYVAAFDKATGAGNDVVVISISSELSKAYENASAAAKPFGARVKVIDSRGASGLQSLLALYAAELVANGDDVETVASKLDFRKLKPAALFAVPEMTHLGRSGRLPKALVALGSLLNVSLVLKINENGVIGPAGQSRSFEKSRDIMVDAAVRITERAPNARFAISHVQAPDTAALVSKAIAERLGHAPAVEIVHESTLTIATHMGPGAVGIFAIVP